MCLRSCVLLLPTVHTLCIIPTLFMHCVLKSEPLSILPPCRCLSSFRNAALKHLLQTNCDGAAAALERTEAHRHKQHKVKRPSSSTWMEGLFIPKTDLFDLGPVSVQSMMTNTASFSCWQLFKAEGEVIIIIIILIINITSLIWWCFCAAPQHWVHARGSGDALGR